MAARKEQEGVAIGTQIWSSSNLNVVAFRNGDLIPEARTAAEWRKAGQSGQPAWCLPEDEKANGRKFGRLYNGHAVEDERGLAPSGWHIPSQEEWATLARNLGAEPGRALKSTRGWTPRVARKVSGGGTNESGFNALPAGFRSAGGTFGAGRGQAGQHGAFWSSTPGLHRVLSHAHDELAVGRGLSAEGRSVRCVRDTPPELHRLSEMLPSLFAAVYAAPSSDGPRAVLADALQELGDPLGEFIALQLSRGREEEPSAREAALLARHRATWIRRFAASLAVTTVRFGRGFPARGQVDQEPTSLGPEWALLEYLRVHSEGAFLSEAPLASIPEIVCMPATAIRTLEKRPREWRRLQLLRGMELAPETPDEVDALLSLCARGRLPRLEHLATPLTPQNLGPLTRWKEAKRVELQLATETLADAIPVVRGSFEQGWRLVLRVTHPLVELRREGRRLELIVLDGSVPIPTVLLEQVPDGALDELKLEGWFQSPEDWQAYVAPALGVLERKATTLSFFTKEPGGRWRLELATGTFERVG